MQPDPATRLPVQVERYDDESGMSFVMRSFWANGVERRRGFAWLGVAVGKPLRAADVLALAWATHAPKHWLMERLFVKPGAVGDRGLHLGAHRIGPAMAMAGVHAPICPHCVKERGYCDLTWALRFVPCCARHGVALMQTCRHCKKPVVWERPAVDVCGCGRYLTSGEPNGVRPDVPSSVPPKVLEWVAWVSRRLRAGDASHAEGGEPCRVPALLERLSIDGAARLVAALGLMSGSKEAPKLAISRTRTVNGMVALLERGLERAKTLDLDAERIKGLSPFVHWPALERMRSQGVEPADVECASLLLKHTGDPGLAGVDRRGRHARGQLSLF